MSEKPHIFEWHLKFEDFSENRLENTITNEVSSIFKQYLKKWGYPVKFEDFWVKTSYFREKDWNFWKIHDNWG